MVSCLIVFVDLLLDFRLPEILSLFQLEGIDIDQVDFSNYAEESQFWKVELPSLELAKAVAQRATLVKNLYILLDQAASLAELLTKWKQHGAPDYLKQFESSFRFEMRVLSYGKREPIESQHDIIASILSHPALPFDQHGIVDLRNPEVVFRFLCRYESPSATVPFDVWLGLEICEGNRHRIAEMALRNRPYLGTTSMDTEMALLMANQALLKPGNLALDPFVGTASILLPLALQSVFTIGLEIDPRIVRGTGRRVGKNKAGTNVLSNFEQFGVLPFTDVLIADSSHISFRQKPFLDAVITDPPYGVREGARKLGTKSEKREAGTKAEVIKLPYDAISIMVDLLNFAARHLVQGGRLVYWLATSRADFSQDDIPLHPCLRLLSTAEQVFGRWSRWLVTMEKIRDGTDAEYGADGSVGATFIPRIQKGEIPSFVTFRDNYFEGRPFEADRCKPITTRPTTEWAARKAAMIRDYKLCFSEIN